MNNDHNQPADSIEKFRVSKMTGESSRENVTMDTYGSSEKVMILDQNNSRINSRAGTLGEKKISVHSNNSLKGQKKDANHYLNLLLENYEKDKDDPEVEELIIELNRLNKAYRGELPDFFKAKLEDFSRNKMIKSQSTKETLELMQRSK